MSKPALEGNNDRIVVIQKLGSLPVGTERCGDVTVCGWRGVGCGSHAKSCYPHSACHSTTSSCVGADVEKRSVSWSQLAVCVSMAVYGCVCRWGCVRRCVCGVGVCACVRVIKQGC